MRPRSVVPNIIASLIVLACVPAMSRAEDWSFDRLTKQTSIWSGFGAGTMIRHRTATEMQIQGRPNAARQTVTETRVTLIDITKTERVLRVEALVDERWVATEKREPKGGKQTDAGIQVKDEGTESITIEGQEYPCRKMKVSDVSAVIGDPMERETDGDTPPGTVWEHETLGILKVETREPAGDRTSTTTQVVTRLGVSHQVGDATLSCREVTWTNSIVGGKTVRLESVAVPGRTVLTTGHVEQGPITMTHVKKLVGLTTKAKATPARK